MKITRDEPGRRLVLEGAYSAPWGTLGCAGLLAALIVGALVGLPIAVLALGNEMPCLVRIVAGVFLAVVCVALVPAFRKAFGYLRRPTLLSFERAEVGIEDRGILSEVSSEERYPSQAVSAGRISWSWSPMPAKPMPIALRDNSAVLGSSSRFQLRLTLRIAAEGGDDKPRERAFTIGVEDLDKREEIADFALRLASAVGLPFYRVVRNEPREVDIELSRAQKAGMERVPAIDTKADYARNAVAASARAVAAEERIPPFDPAAFTSASRVSVWNPGREVRFEKPLSAAIVCAPGIAALLAGPVVFAWTGSEANAMPLGQRLGLASLIGFFGLVIGLMAAAVVSASLPRRVALDWTVQRLAIAALRGRKEIPFSELVAIGLKTVVRSGKNRRFFRCQVVAYRRTPGRVSTTEVLIETESYGSDPDTPYRATLPLVTELARALKVERRLQTPDI